MTPAFAWVLALDYAGGVREQLIVPNTADDPHDGMRSALLVAFDRAAAADRRVGRGPTLSAITVGIGVYAPEAPRG